MTRRPYATKCDGIIFRKIVDMRAHGKTWDEIDVTLKRTRAGTQAAHYVNKNLHTTIDNWIQPKLSDKIIEALRNGEATAHFNPELVSIIRDRATAQGLLP